MQYNVVLPGAWQACYEKRPFLVSHNLTGSDEFSIDALQALACCVWKLSKGWY